MVPVARIVTWYVWPGTRTRVWASTSKNGSIRAGFVNSMAPLVTR
jgi:hypothetical protein